MSTIHRPTPLHALSGGLGALVAAGLLAGACAGPVTGEQDLRRMAITEGRDPEIFRGEPEVPAWVRERSQAAASTSQDAGAVAASSTTVSARAAGPLVVDRVEVHHLTSRLNGVEYELRVSLPHGYETPGKRFPVVYTLDADYSFLIARNITDHLSERDHLEEVVVVGIGYRNRESGRGADYRRDRTRDYTPTFVADGGYGAPFQELSGGGPKFLEVLEREILPYVDRTFRTLPDDRTLVGHSYGGLFALWTLFTRPDVFTRYVAVSPSLWYDDQLVSRVERAYADGHDALPGRLYMCAGSLENPRMPGDLRQLAAALERRRYRGLAFESLVMDGETHNSIFPGCLSNGLRYVLEGR